jgi:hypothetical protein
MTISPNKWELDVQGYLNTCNISDSTARQQIRDFAKGVNDLGLWNSMVCWPLRSSQNYGSGTTAFSLGGLGAFNGTLTNGPTWGADGIAFDGIDDGITTSFTLGSTQVFCGFVGDVPTSGVKGNFFGGINSNSNAIYWVNPRSGFGGQYRYGTAAGQYVAVADNITGGVQMWSAIGGAGLNTKGYRSTTLLGTAGTAATEPSPNLLNTGLLLGRTLGGYEGKAAFTFIIHAAPAAPDAFYALYKTTLGTGLGLS